MTVSHKTLYLLINAAIVTASAIQLVRGYKWYVILICAITFIGVGNLTVWFAGSRQRAIARQRKRDFYAN